MINSATTQSILSLLLMDCFASLAMTANFLISFFRGIPCLHNGVPHPVLSGDGIGPEVMAPALKFLRKIERRRPEVSLHRGAGRRQQLCRDRQIDAGEHGAAVRRADAILLGAAAAVGARPRQHRNHAAGGAALSVRPLCRLCAGARDSGVPSPIVAPIGAIDLIVIRESTEGLFASMGKGVVTDTEARETLVITRKTSERLFEFSVRLAERRKARAAGSSDMASTRPMIQGLCVFPRDVDEAASRHPGVKARPALCRCCSALLVKRPWDFA